MNIKAWIWGLGTAVISAAADSGVALLGATVFAPELMRDGRFWLVLFGTIGFAALKSAFLYLKKSPLPGVQQ